MSQLTPEAIKAFIVQYYPEKLGKFAGNPVTIPDSFDLLQEGVVDSFGILDLTAALETKFGINIDFEGLEAEQISIVGPLSQYLARTGQAAKAS